MMHPKCFFSPFYSALQSVSFLRMGKEAGGERGVLGLASPFLEKALRECAMQLVLAIRRKA